MQQITWFTLSIDTQQPHASYTPIWEEKNNPYIFTRRSRKAGSAHGEENFKPIFLLEICCIFIEFSFKTALAQTVPPRYCERPLWAGFRLVNPAERWRQNPARAEHGIRNSISLAIVLRLSCSNPSMYNFIHMFGNFRFVPAGNKKMHNDMIKTT